MAYAALDGGAGAPLLASDSRSPLTGALPGLSALSDVAPVDEGFTNAPALARGRVLVKAGAQHMDISSLQMPQTAGEAAASAAAVAAALLIAPVGLCYLASKLTLVRAGEIALVRSISGRTRALGPGWHLAETVGCDVLKASVADAVIKFGNLTIVRVLPGSVGLAELNGQPLLLSPGTHLVRLTRTTPPARCARNCDPNDPNTHLARAPRP